MFEEKEQNSAQVCLCLLLVVLIVISCRVLKISIINSSHYSVVVVFIRIIISNGSFISTAFCPLRVIGI